MFPFSVTQQRARKETPSQMADSGYELIAFNAEKLNVFAAQVRYCEPHWHAAPELITVLDGDFSVVAGNQTVLLEKGDMLYINAGEVHSLNAEREASQLITVQFSPGLFDALHPAPLLAWCTQGRTFTASDRLVHHKLVVLVEQLVSQDSPFQRLAAIYTLLDALMNAGVAVSPPESTLREAAMIKKGIDYINQQFDTPLTLSDVARHAGMSYSWFSRLFKKVSRHNFKAYLTLVRVNKAKTLLRDTRIPITEISHTCGFPEHKYLITAFNKYCGMTPGEYRKRYFSMQNASPHGLTLAEDCQCLPLNEMLPRIAGLQPAR
ncbi:AraC family transcriptional regulator [Phytobacter sp. V91]|uniref:AraC family transcriptional regulator n=1 Tax=Phytobacter sp. V91 TaxID=3369425 RepID=UPI003F62D596